MAYVTEKRNILLCVTGSIAAYKSVELARMLIKRGFNVKVVLSESAQRFVTPTTFHVITGNSVITNIWDDSSGSIDHIKFADWADLIVVSPATADFLARTVVGLADTAISCLVLATKAPVLIAPAMNVNMWENPTTVENVNVLKERGFKFVMPETGTLACGWNGEGRLADLKKIFYDIKRALSKHDFSEQKVVVVCGPTREPIDSVRFISNRSSGKMGVAIAREIYRRGGDVTMIHGPITKKVCANVKTVRVNTADEMLESVLEHVFCEETPANIVIMLAAVADFKCKDKYESKVKKKDFPDALELVENIDILKTLGDKRQSSGENLRTLVGFAVETGEIDDLLSEAERKLTTKGLDLMVGNFAEDAFDLNTNRVWMVDKFGRREEVGTAYKSRVANKILDKISKLNY